MANIVEGLFGLTPSQVQQQQQAQINAQAAQYANADPFQRAAMGMYQGGAGLAGIGAGMMGMQNKDVAAAQAQQQFASQIDMTTPEGVMEGAKAAQARGDSAMAVKLVALARQMQEEQSTAAYRDAQSKQMLASAEGKQSSATQATSSYAKELVDAGYAYGTPEFNAKMREHLAGKTRVVGGRVGGGGGVASAVSPKVAAELSKVQADATESNALLDRVEIIGPKATGSGIGAMWDAAGRFIGKPSSEGAKAAAAMKVLGASLTAKVPKMSGPQSDKDVLMYKEAAGNIADPNVPWEEKQAAVAVVREINNRQLGYLRGEQQKSANGEQKSSQPKTITLKSGKVVTVTQ